MGKLYRDYGPAIVMLGASLVLVLVLLVEWLYFQGQKSDLRARLAAKESVNPQGAEAPAIDNSLPSLEQYAEMIQRPLFMEGRRPPPEEEQPAADEAPAEQLPLNLKLMGVVFTPKEKTALFVDEKGKYRRVRRNNLVDGWKLQEVREDRVVMTQGSDQKELPLLKPKPKVPPPAGQKPPSGKAQIRGPGQPPPEDADDSDQTGNDETDNADNSDDGSGEENTDDSSEVDEGSDEQEE